MAIKTRSQAQRYAKKLAKQMRLADWTIVVDSGLPEDSGAAAVVGCITGRKIARIRFAECFYGAPPDSQREIMCHELLHCHSAHADELVRDHLADDLSNAWTLAMEYGVDGVAAGYAKLLPLPE